MISVATRTTKLAFTTATKRKPGYAPAPTLLGDVRLGRG